MRNLKTIAYRETKLKNDLPLTATTWDAGSDTLICAFGPTPTQPIIELKRRNPALSSDEEFAIITSWDAPCPLPNLECDEVLLLQHFSDIATSCLVLAGGDVVVVREEPSPDQEKIEIVGSVDVGICAAAWAPDEELLAIVTRTDTLVLMSRNFEPLNEATLSPDDLHVSKHVSVGWGKKETQFQGKRAKAMRDPTMPETVDEGKPSRYENGKATISWRGDGQYVAINNIVPNRRRAIRVFSREAILDSASEPVDGLESALSWRPSGNLIAAIKRSDAKVEVIFFERNGLRHGQFELRLTRDDMDSWASDIGLSWNNDSTVLAVSFMDRVQFWTMGNYHYYLKQEVQLNSHQNRAPLKWHPETPLRVSFGASENLLDLTFESTITRGSTVVPYDHGIVSVVDGKTLKLTPFKQSGVPPPMSYCEVSLTFSIIDSAISRDGQKIAVLTTDTVELCQWATRLSPKGEIKFTTEVQIHSLALPRLADSGESLRYTQVVQKDDEVYILAPGQADVGATCHKLIWRDDPTTAGFEEVSIPLGSQNLLVDIFFESIFCTDPLENATLSISANNGVEQTWLNGCQANTSLFTIPDGGSEGVVNGRTSQYHKISLTAKGNLYVDDTLLARDSTSYILTPAHLIFTTSQHLLKFIHVTDPANMQVPGDTPEVDERCRNVERGARIVTVVPSTYAMILQMPRGNLETIYPRLLVLTGIRNHLKQQDYLAAFLACQTHQVDMNMLYDYDPETFLANVPKFIDQLKKASRLDEFLSKLKDEDVTQTLYRDTLAAQPQAQTQPELSWIIKANNKVNRIADAFISALASRPSPYLQNMITAHVSKRPPDLNAALSLVSSLRQAAEEEADMAVAHLCFLADANRLFDAALALYDLELTLLVAQNSQRDPREYMPFLQSLHDLPVLRRRYQIDNHLKKYSKALVSLHALESHDEVRTYTIKHGLYTTAMDLYKYDRAHLEPITRLYAEHLASQSRHASAATLFESLGDYEAAYPLYASAHKWRESLTCATLVPLDRERLVGLASSLAATCADVSRDYRSAATIHIDYLDDIPGGARLLCKGSYFAEALRILAMKPPFVSEIPAIIDSGLTKKFGEILELVAECKAQLNSQIPRIEELRRKKEDDPLAFYGGDPSLMGANGGVDIPDNISLAATDATTLGGQSLFTRYGSNASKFGGTVASSNVSRRTSKTKRREERKRARGKKGSVYEEEYLVDSVGRLIERVNGVHDEVKRLISGLLRRGMRDQAVKVEEVLKDIYKQCCKARTEVWQLPPGDGVQPDTYDVNGEGRPPGADGVFWESQQELRKKEAPEVKVWPDSELMS